MFTGLVDGKGTITAVETLSEGGARLTVSTSASSNYLDDVSIGDSIALDGVCTTAVVLDKTEETFDFEASPETLAMTTMSEWETGRQVNLEKPLLPHSRLGGHFVTGHVDGQARLVSLTDNGNSKELWFELVNPEQASAVIPKGSIAIDGISLTVNEVKGTKFSIAIIPHTWQETNLKRLSSGDIVNIETDMLGKYVVKLVNQQLQSMNINPQAITHQVLSSGAPV